jgi:hypothetical protein
MRAVAMLDRPNPTHAPRIAPSSLTAGGHYYLVLSDGVELRFAYPYPGSARIDIFTVDGEVVEQARTVSRIMPNGFPVRPVPPSRGWRCVDAKLQRLAKAPAMGAATTGRDMITLKLEPRGRGLTAVMLFDQELVVGRGAVVFAAARRLLERGHDPAERLEAWRGDTLCLSGRLGAFARLTVQRRAERVPKVPFISAASFGG